MIPMRAALMDVDFTLYPKGTGPFVEVSRNIETFVRRRLGLDQAQTKTLRAAYIERYGSTLGGLMHEHAVDPQEFLADVHDVAVEAMLGDDPRLRATLTALKLPLVAFSNGSEAYIRRVLRALGVEDLFAEIFSIEAMGFIPKPRLEPYRKLITKLGLAPDTMVMVDDMYANILTAQGFGLHGILVDKDARGDIPVIPDIYALPQAVEAMGSVSPSGGTL